jgi:hypothetical protein
MKATLWQDEYCAVAGPSGTPQDNGETDMSFSFIELLEDVLDNVEDAIDTLAIASDPPAADDRTLVAEYISTAETRIDLALDHLDDAGEVDLMAALNGLRDVADECVTLAQQALEEHASPQPSDNMIGTKLKTLKHLIGAPGGYRELAGI